MKYIPTKEKLFRDETGTYHLTDKNRIKAGLPENVYKKCLKLKLIKAIKPEKEVTNG